MALNVVLSFCDSFATANFLHNINQCDSPYNLLILNATLQLLSPSFPRFIYLKLEWSTSLAEYQWGNKSIKELQCGIQNKNILDNSHFFILCTQLFNVFCLICNLRIISLQLLLKLFQSLCQQHFWLVAVVASDSRSLLADGCYWSRRRGIAG